MIPTHRVDTMREGIPNLFGRVVQIDMLDDHEKRMAEGGVIAAVLYDDDIKADFKHRDQITITAINNDPNALPEIAVYGANVVHRQGGFLPQTVVELVAGWY